MPLRVIQIYETPLVGLPQTEFVLFRVPLKTILKREIEIGASDTRKADDTMLTHG